MNESNARTALAHYLQTAWPTSRVIPEFWIPVSHERADLVLVGQYLEGFEIKSQKDNLLRLSRQVSAYGRVFDRCTAVVAERHLPGVVHMLPPWWGILSIDLDGGAFTMTRPARENPSVDLSILVRVLWKAEVRLLLTELGQDAGPCPSRELMWDLLLATAPESLVRRRIRDVISGRRPEAARFGSPALRSSFRGQGVAIATS